MDMERRGAPEGGMGKYYMNKMFGAGLDRARQADEDHDKRMGTISRITIEPREDGMGHRVTVEKHSMMMHGGNQDMAEHEFEKPEDALEFLRELLHRRGPGEQGEREETIDSAKRPPRGPGSDLESVLSRTGRDEDEDAW